uniref:DUF3615 domain-containing protein n=1 Tax=Aegilops tauschii subsp. strangulata TaxID=200361 RepID=A0A453RN26_AEGTS
MSTTLLIGTSVFTSGSIVQDFSTHILVSVDHSRAYMKLKRLLSAILMTSGIKRCMWNEQAGDSGMDMVIKKALYWPDGRTRKCSDKEVVDHTREQMSLMLQALLDKYNEDHNLVGDLAYEFKDFLHYRSICEDYKWYKHFNFTTKTKDGTEDLFFAEVTEGTCDELVANCFCKIESNENGHCYGCINHGITDMKHPDKADAYSGGHLNVYLPFGGCRSRPNTWTGSKEDVTAEEARLRYIYGIQ